MKKKILLLLFCSVYITQQPKAQVPVIDGLAFLAKKVINAIDLKIQRLQTNTIWLQNAQKELENILSKVKLGEISDWLERQRLLYEKYFEELWRVKQLIASYDKIRQIIILQSKILSEYRLVYARFQRDKHFSQGELDYMYKVYSGILDESIKNLDQALLVVNAFVTQMSDEERLHIIDQAASGLQTNYNDLKQFNNQHILLSLQRAADTVDIASIKQLYGLQ